MAPSSNKYNDYFKNFGNFENPVVDLNSLMSLQRRNFEALSAANQALVEGVQAVSRRNGEVARESVEGFLKATKDIMTGKSPENNTAKQADYVRSSYESAVSNAREISEMLSKSCFEAFDVLNKRASESVSELSKAAKKAA